MDFLATTDGETLGTPDEDDRIEIYGGDNQVLLGINEAANDVTWADLWLHKLDDDGEPEGDPRFAGELELPSREDPGVTMKLKTDACGGRATKCAVGNSTPSFTNGDFALIAVIREAQWDGTSAPDAEGTFLAKATYRYTLGLENDDAIVAMVTPPETSELEEVDRGSPETFYGGPGPGGTLKIEVEPVAYSGFKVEAIDVHVTGSGLTAKCGPETKTTGCQRSTKEADDTWPAVSFTAEMMKGQQGALAIGEADGWYTKETKDKSYSVTSVEPTFAQDPELNDDGDLLLDYKAPTGVTFKLQKQNISEGKYCCSSSWVSGNYALSTGVAKTATAINVNDAGGVKGIGLTIHIGEAKTGADIVPGDDTQIESAEMKDGELVFPTTPTTIGKSGLNLESSETNDAYQPLVKAVDALGNSAVFRLDGSATEGGGLIGIDMDRPVLRVDESESVIDRTRNRNVFGGAHLEATNDPDLGATALTFEVSDEQRTDPDLDSEDEGLLRFNFKIEREGGASTALGVPDDFEWTDEAVDIDATTTIDFCSDADEKAMLDGNDETPEDPCVPDPDPEVDREVATMQRQRDLVDGYWTLTALAIDEAGNISRERTREMLLDGTSPILEAANMYFQTETDGTKMLYARATDNVGLREVRFMVTVGGITLTRRVIVEEKRWATTRKEEALAKAVVIDYLQGVGDDDDAPTANTLLGAVRTEAITANAYDQAWNEMGECFIT